MAGDWIKMRPSLISSPKVNGIARFLESSNDVSVALSTGFTGKMSEIVTRNVMRNVVISSLLIIWGAANEHTEDGVFNNADLSDIDDIVGIPCFGDAMVSVGWAVFDSEKVMVTLPNFNEYNTCGKDRAAEKAAERQRRFRENHKSSNVTKPEVSNVTNNVTRNDREEKRREENKNQDQKQKTGRAPRFDAQAHLVSIGIDPVIASDWVSHRKTLKATPSLTAIDGIATEADRAGISLSAALAMCCQRGWRGFKAGWIADDNQRNGKTQHQLNQEATTRAIFGNPSEFDFTEKLISGEVIS